MFTVIQSPLYAPQGSTDWTVDDIKKGKELVCGNCAIVNLESRRRIDIRKVFCSFITIILSRAALNTTDTANINLLHHIAAVELLVGKTRFHIVSKYSRTFKRFQGAFAVVNLISCMQHNVMIFVSTVKKRLLKE